MVIPSIQQAHFTIIKDGTKAQADVDGNTMWVHNDHVLRLYLIQTPLTESPHHPFQDNQYTLQLRNPALDPVPEHLAKPKAYKSPGSNPPPPDHGFLVNLRHSNYLEQVRDTGLVGEEEQVFQKAGSDPLVFVIVPNYTVFTSPENPPTGTVHTLACPF